MARKNENTRQRAPGSPRNRKRHKGGTSRHKGGPRKGSRVAGDRKQARKASKPSGALARYLGWIASRLGTMGRCFARRCQAVWSWPRVRKAERLALALGIAFVVLGALMASMGVRAD